MASGRSHKRAFEPDPIDRELASLNSWEDVICPICMEIPHNSVLLLCSAFRNGCRPFICDTNTSHSNCFERFKNANGISPVAVELKECTGTFDAEILLACPLCRGELTGWIVVDDARNQLNQKRRCCEEQQCPYSGNYTELQHHTLKEHPDSRPSEIDPARREAWARFQQTTEVVDILNTINSEIPNGVVSGDYVIEYSDGSSDEFDDFPGDEGNSWSSTMLSHVFDNFRASRRPNSSRVSEISRTLSRVVGRAMADGDGSVAEVDMQEHNLVDFDSELEVAARASQVITRGQNRVNEISRTLRRVEGHALLADGDGSAVEVNMQDQNLDAELEVPARAGQSRARGLNSLRVNEISRALRRVVGDVSVDGDGSVAQVNMQDHNLANFDSEIEEAARAGQSTGYRP